MWPFKEKNLPIKEKILPTPFHETLKIGTVYTIRLHGYAVLLATDGENFTFGADDEGRATYSYYTLGSHLIKPRVIGSAPGVHAEDILTNSAIIIERMKR